MDAKYMWFWMMIFFLFSFLVATEPIYAQMQKDSHLEKDNAQHQSSGTSAMPVNDKDVQNNPVNRLENKKKEMESRFQLLLEEKKQLEIEKNIIETRTELKTVNTKILNYKKKVNQYDADKKLLDAEIEAYNQTIQEKPIQEPK